MKPTLVRMRPNGHVFAVTNLRGDTVSMIDVREARELGRVFLESAPVQVAWSPDGQRLYATLPDENAVVVIDPDSEKVTASVPVGDAPVELASTPDGAFLYVANEGSVAKRASTVSVIDTSTLRVVKTIETGRGTRRKSRG